MRTKKSFYNLLSTMIPQIIIAFLAIFRTKYFLVGLGDEVYGIYQLFGQILAYLSLADLGLTTAVNYYLYKPISEKNYQKISSILVGAKRYFYRIMFVMLGIGLVFSPFVRFFIRDYTVPNLFLITAFILLLIVNILSYSVTAYTVMFNANQERYKYSVYTQSILIVRYIIEIVVVLLTKNLFVIIIIEILTVLLQNIIIKILFKRNFKKINFKEKPDYSFVKKTKSIIPHKISSLISNNMDILLISKILGITVVPIYTCNYYIINMLNQVISKISQATIASVGNVIALNKKDAFNLFLEYNALLFMIASFICIPLLGVFTPFVKIWYGSNYTVSFITMISFVVLLFYYIIRIVLNNFADGAGLYKETLICTIPEAILNLIISLLLINKLKILGVVLGTILSLIISEYLIKPFILNKYIFKSKINKYYLDSLKYIFFAILNSCIIILISKYLRYSNLIYWFINGLALFILNFILVMLEYKLIKRNYLWNRIKLLKNQIFNNEKGEV